jgi:hypothetical protein
MNGGDATPLHRAHFSPSSSCAKLSFYISELSVGNQAPEPLLAHDIKLWYHQLTNKSGHS